MRRSQKKKTGDRGEYHSSADDKRAARKEAEVFVSEEKEVKTAKDAIAGACDIIAESISDEADYRMEIRRRTEAKGLIVSTAKDEKAESVYENTMSFPSRYRKLPDTVCWH